MNEVDELVQWLSQHLDADANVAWVAAETAGDDQWALQGTRVVALANDQTVVQHDTAEISKYIASNAPARAVHEISAKRQLLAEHAPRDGRCRVCTAHAHDSWTRFRAPCTTLRLLALPYWDRPGYREEWRP